MLQTQTIPFLVNQKEAIFSKIKKCTKRSQFMKKTGKPNSYFSQKIRQIHRTETFWLSTSVCRPLAREREQERAKNGIIA